MKGRDMYADLEKIEARGKRKKGKKEGFSLFGKKGGQEEPESTPKVEPAPMPEPEESPTPEIQEESSVHESPAEPTPASTETAVSSEASEQIVYSEPESVEEQQPEESVVITEISESLEQPEQASFSPPESTEEVESSDTTSSSEMVELVESRDDIVQPEEEKDERTLQDSQFYQRDIYAALDNIEQRGKSLKEKRSGLFRLQERPAEEPTPGEVVETPVVTEPTVEPVEEPVVEITAEPEPFAEPTREEFVQEAIPEPEPRWEPLSGRNLKKAEAELLQYKRKLDKGFRSGQLTKEQCLSMVGKKEIELGLKPPTENS